MQKEKEIEKIPRYILTEDRQVVDIATGEVIDKKEIQELQVSDLEHDTNQLNQELRASGSETVYKLVKIYNEKFNCVEIKKGFTYGKVFRVELRKIMENKVLSKNARVVIATLEPFLSFPRNTVIINSKTPTMKEIQNIVEIGKTNLYQALAELEEKEVIKRVKSNGQTLIYFNPFLYVSGGYVEVDTYELFKHSQYNPKPIYT